MQQIMFSDASYIKKVRSLHTKKGRQQHKLFIGQGTRTCETLIDNGIALEKLLVTDQHFKWAQSVTHKKKIIQVNVDHIMKKISTTKTPSGVVGVFVIPERPLPEKFENGLVLAGVSDPGNAGTLIRSAAAFGTTSVICIDTVDPWNPKVVQATVGCIGAVKIYLLSWKQVIKHKKDSPLYALVVGNGIPLHTVKKIPHLLVVGSEARGIPHEWLADCDALTTIPMSKKTESLNAAVAGSIALYSLQKK